MFNTITFEVRNAHVLLLLIDYISRKSEQFEFYINVPNRGGNWVTCAVTSSEETVVLESNIDPGVKDYRYIPISEFRQIAANMYEFIRYILGDAYLENNKDVVTDKVTFEIISVDMFNYLLNSYLEDGQFRGEYNTYSGGFWLEYECEELGKDGIEIYKEYKIRIKAPFNSPSLYVINQSHFSYADCFSSNTFKYKTTHRKLIYEIRSMEDLHKFMTKEFT